MDFDPHDLGEGREIVLHDIEDDLVVDLLIGVAQLVSNGCQSPPMRGRVPPLKVVGQMPRSFRNDLQRSLNPCFRAQDAANSSKPNPAVASRAPSIAAEISWSRARTERPAIKIFEQIRVRCESAARDADRRAS